jgi:MFS family permease
MFFFVGLAGVIPIMISAKQSGFYILATYPLFAIALGSLVEPLVNYLLDRCSSRKIFVFKIIGYTVFCVGVSLCFYFSTTIGRDENKIKDTYKMLNVLPEGSIINILPSMYADWSLHAYYARYGAVSLDPEIENKRDYLLIVDTSSIDESILSQYQEVDVETVNYKLFKRK